MHIVSKGTTHQLLHLVICSSSKGEKGVRFHLCLSWFLSDEILIWLHLPKKCLISKIHLIGMSPKKPDKSSKILKSNCCCLMEIIMLVNCVAFKWWVVWSSTHWCRFMSILSIKKKRRYLTSRLEISSGIFIYPLVLD